MTPVYLNPSSTSPFSPYNINIVQHATEEDLRLKLLNTSLPLPYQSLANSSSLISFPTFFHSSDNQRRTYGSSNTTNFGDQALLYYQRADDKLVWNGEPSRDQACTSETLVRPVVNVSSSDEYTDKINLEDHVRNIGEPRGSRLKQKTTSVMDHQIPDQKFQSVHHVDFQLQENNMGETSSNILAAVSNNNNSSGGSTTASGVRVCSDCSTSTTPLWRSGPRGPKSLCNACGIRQRKARRAMAEFETAAAANASAVCTNRSPTVATTTASSMSKVMDKKPRGNHNSNKRKLDTASTASLTCYKTKNKQKAASPQSVLLPQDVAEAAMLLMELSSGLMNHSS